MQKIIIDALQKLKETWIGGSDAHEVGEWFWSDGSHFDYNDWCAGEPSVQEAQRCLQINYTEDKCWDNIECSTERPSVCVKDAEDFRDVFVFPPNDVFRTLEWSKTDLKKVIVFLFRDNREDLVEQSPLYESRTNLSVEDLKSGNASLRISNIQAADAGTYQCMRMWKKGQENTTEVELFVVGGFTLECEATNVGSDAEITFLDENGRNLSADDPKQNVSRGCYTVQRRVTLQEAASRVTCRVQRADTNETRETKIQLPEQITLTGVSSGESARDIRVDNAENETIEKLQTEVAAQSERDQDKETICKLNKDIAKLAPELELDEMNQQDDVSSNLLSPPKSTSLHKRLPRTSSESIA
ncbi:hypothetical protein JOQ06_026120 [Pogonophryne albipinna]|uniref:C-type lectin domain-containing protein n=1 Tax=Pogonophryne albipinna TaxID=1090488 RepID=A0AAD6F673_9TELE|nr:hypothetical protein JOQ06_026120 [Pogonophryne albipinna]